MSRFQCRFFIKPGEGLWVSDLGSANGTMVNGKLVHEQQLHCKDEVLAGDTHFRVLDVGNSAEVPVDPGVNKGTRSSGAGAPNALRKKLIWLIVVLASGVALISLKNNMGSVFEQPASVQVPVPMALPVFELSFERVEGSVSNIFRYSLELKHDVLRVEVDDLTNKRHVRRDKKVTPEIQRELARSIEATGVMDLREEYCGLAPGFYDLCDMSVTIGAVTRRIRVLNQPVPEVFATARAMIEDFGKNELGLDSRAVEPSALVE
jgi:hypothetical protein